MAETEEEKVELNDEKSDKDVKEISWKTNLISYFIHLRKPHILLMVIAGCFRHTAGFSWGYNQVLYYSETFPEEKNTKIYLMICPILAGVCGATLGGFITDHVKKSKRFSGAKGEVKFFFKVLSRLS